MSTTTRTSSVRVRPSRRMRQVTHASADRPIVIEIVAPAPAASVEADEDPERRAFLEHQVQIEAARLRQLTDRKLGKTTPEWVNRLAAERSDDGW